MKQRHQQLLHLLARQEWIKGRELASCLGVSARTVRSDIEQINREMPHIIQADRQKGYHLVAFQQNRYADPEGLLRAPQDSAERSANLLKQLLFNGEGVSIEAFCEQCFVSAKTFDIDRIRAQQQLEEYDGLELVTKNGALVLEGPEASKRKLYRELLKKELNEDFLNSSELMNVYPELDMEQLEAIIWAKLKEYRYSIRKTLMPFLLLHLGLVLQRVKLGQTVQEGSVEGLDLEVEATIVRSIFKEILGDKEIPEGEILSYAKLLKAYHNSNAFQSEVHFKGKTIRLEELTNAIDERLFQWMGISFVDQKEFKVRFQLHLQGLLERVQMNLSLPNHYVQTFKRQYPLVFDTAVSVSQYLMNELQCQITEEEIGFLALHIGAAYMQGATNAKLSAVLIANTQYPLIAGSVERLKEQFQHRLDFVAEEATFTTGVTEFYEADLLITFEQKEPPVTIPVVRLGLFFNTQDEIQLIRVMNTLETQKMSETIRTQIGQLMDEDFFYADVEATSREEILMQMGSRLEEAGIVTEDFLDSVMKRESLSSTDFDYSIAIPHPLHPSSNRSMISIAVLREPIQWNHFPVKLVILLALKEEDMEFMQLFLRWLGKQLDSPDKMMCLLEAKNVESFIQAIR